MSRTKSPCAIAIVALTLSLIATACGGDAPESLATVEASSSSDSQAIAETQEQTSAEPEAVAMPEADEPIEETTDEVEDAEVDTIEDEPTDEEPTPDEQDDVTLCDVRRDETAYVDVALDDPDGGLNVRVAPGASNKIVAVLPRNTFVVATGECIVSGGADWWKVIYERGTDPAWVHSGFLSLEELPAPGLGDPVPHDDVDGITAPTLDELIEKIADSYDFEDGHTVTLLGEPEGTDASSGTVTFDLTGLKSDSVNGYRVELGFNILRDASGDELLGYSAFRTTQWPICSRGVSDEGLCI